MLWTDKYKPSAMGDIPQEEIIAGFKTAIRIKKPVLLVGPSGTGKTALVYAFAKEGDLEILEVNASDFRNKAAIESIVGNCSQQQSLFMREKLILIDELDGISGKKDRGGVGAIVKILKSTKVPIVLISNDPYNPKINDIRKLCTVLEFDRVTFARLAGLLGKICEQEEVEFDKQNLSALVAKANGDIRAAILDLQTYSAGKVLEADDLESRNQEETITNALKVIFKSPNIELPSRSLSNVDMNLDECLLWLDENIPYEYKDPGDIERAYDCLSKADVYRGRIRRRQHWRLLVYQNFFMTSGIASAKKETYPEFASYKRTMRLLKIWRANMKLQKVQSIAEKIASYTHCSAKQVMKDFSYYKKFLTEPSFSELGLTEEEINFLKK